MLSRHVLNVSYFLIIIKSCSIESRNDPSPKSDLVHETKFSLKISYSTHACLAQLDRHQTCKPVMVSHCCEFEFHWRQLNFVQKCQKCQDLLFTKTSNVDRSPNERLERCSLIRSCSFQEINYLFTDTACFAIVISLKLNVRDVQRRTWETIEFNNMFINSGYCNVFPYFATIYIHLTIFLIVNEHFTPNLVGLLCTQVAFKLELSLYLLLIVQ